MSSSVIAREEPRTESAVALPLPRQEAAITLGVAALIACLTASLLAAQSGVENLRLVAVTLTMTAVWALTLHWSWSFARLKRVASPVAALVAALVGLAGVSLANFWVFDTVVPATDLLVIGGSVFAVAWVAHGLAASRVRPRPRIAFVGTDDDSVQTIRALQREKRKELDLVGFLGESSSRPELDEVPCLGDEDDIVEVVRRARPELIACARSRREAIVDTLLDEGIASIPVIDVFELQERAFRRVAAASVSAAWFAGVLGVNQRYPARAKRVFDISVATAALLLAAPLFLLIPLAIRLSGRGPVFYRQSRTGEGGRLFRIVKFRTMIPDAENGSAVWAAESDPRVTAVGRVLRKTRLDELPQLWNVLRGEMSIVGPRPERPEFMPMLSEQLPCWNRRHLVKPGITGWAQVQYSYTADVSGAATKLAYDLYYLKHRSLGLDLLILMKTIGVVLSRSGAR